MDFIEILLSLQIFALNEVKMSAEVSVIILERKIGTPTVSGHLSATVFLDKK